MYCLTKKTPSFYIILSIVLASLSACKEKKEKSEAKPDRPTVVDVLIASPKSVTNIIEANGSVIANETTDLQPEVSGRLTYLNVPEGKYVTQGTVLARINSADLEAQVQRTKVQLEIATKTEERLRKLLEVNGINQSDYDVALNNVNTLKADIEYTQTLIDKTVVKAPFSGTLGFRRVSPGAYVSPATVLATLQQLGKMKIDFTLPDEFGYLVKIGSVVRVRLDGKDTTMKRASVIAIEPQVNRQTRNLSVRAMLDNASANPGAFAKVFVGSSTDKSAIMVPTGAVIPDDRNNQVIVVKGGKATFVNVQTGVRNDNNIEITKGITPGDSIVVTGVLFAKPDKAVKVRKVVNI